MCFDDSILNFKFSRVELTTESLFSRVDSCDMIPVNGVTATKHNSSKSLLMLNIMGITLRLP